MQYVWTKIKNYPKIKLIYFSTMLFFIGVSIFNCIFTNGEALYDMLVPNYENHYWDLITSIYHNFLRTPYEEGVVYPPGANVICWIISTFFPPETYNIGVNAMRDSQTGMLIVIWFLVITTIILLALICRNSNMSSLENGLFIFSLLFSAPFLRQVTKMNLVIFSVIFVYLFLIYKNSPNRALRILAFMFLASAVSIKIYPVFFGLFLVKEKNWKSVFICILLGILLFFLPFFMFGGLNNVFVMLENIFKTTTVLNESGLGFKIDITNTINLFGDLLGNNSVNIRSIGTAINYTFVILSIISFFFLKSNWKSVAILSLLTLSYPTFSNSYAILIMIPSLLYFFNEEYKLTTLNLIYVIIFSLLFTPMCFGGQDIFPSLPGVTRVNLSTFIESICILLMELFLIGEGISRICEILLSKLRRIGTA